MVVLFFCDSLFFHIFFPPLFFSALFPHRDLCITRSTIRPPPPSPSSTPMLFAAKARSLRHFPSSPLRVSRHRFMWRVRVPPPQPRCRLGESRRSRRVPFVSTFLFPFYVEFFLPTVSRTAAEPDDHPAAQKIFPISSFSDGNIPAFSSSPYLQIFVSRVSSTPPFPTGSELPFHCFLFHSLVPDCVSPRYRSIRRLFFFPFLNEPFAGESSSPPFKEVFSAEAQNAAPSPNSNLVLFSRGLFSTETFLF